MRKREILEWPKSLFGFFCKMLWENPKEFFGQRNTNVLLCSNHTKIIHSMWCYPHLCVLSPFSRVQLFATLWTAACQASLSMGFSRQEYWSGLPCLPPDLPDLGIKPASLSSPALAGEFCTTSATWEALALIIEPSV